MVLFVSFCLCILFVFYFVSYLYLLQSKWCYLYLKIWEAKDMENCSHELFLLPSQKKTLFSLFLAVNHPQWSTIQPMHPIYFYELLQIWQKGSAWFFCVWICEYHTIWQNYSGAFPRRIASCAVTLEFALVLIFYYK